MSAASDIKDMFITAGMASAYDVQIDFFRDSHNDRPVILLRSDGGAVANTLESQPVFIMALSTISGSINTKDARAVLESIKSAMMSYDYTTATSGIYNIDIVGGILPLQMSDGRTGYSMNVIARYGRTEAIL